MSSMRTTVDRAGRLVIPRSLRNRVGLAAGGEVEVEIDGASIRIEPVVSGVLSERDGLLFIPRTGRSLDDKTVRGLVNEERSGR